MQNGYVVSDVLQSCSWERWRLRVSINHIVIQLPYILKRKTNGLSGITVFFRCECTFIAYRIINLKEIVSKIVMCFTIPFSFIFPTEW